MNISHRQQQLQIISTFKCSHSEAEIKKEKRSNRSNKQFQTQRKIFYISSPVGVHPLCLPQSLPPSLCYPHSSSSPLSAALCWLFGLLCAYQAHRCMSPSNTAFILSLPWQLPISPKESAGSVFPWRWHGDIARWLWTACRDSITFFLSFSHPAPPSQPILVLPFNISVFGSSPSKPWSFQLFEGAWTSMESVYISHQVISCTKKRS